MGCLRRPCCGIGQLACLTLIAVAGYADDTYVPTPQPVAGSVNVGCYYFPVHYHALRWRPMAESGGPKPLIGYYDGGSPEVLDWHVKFAVEHGIRFFVFDWYYDHQTDSVSSLNAGIDAFLASRYGGLMQFSLMWCNENGTPYAEPQLVRMTEAIAERYLSHTNFLKVDGRPVLWVSRPLHLLDVLGVDGLRDAVRSMNAKLEEHGHAPFFLVANTNERYDELVAAGFEAVSAYNYPQAGMDPAGKSAPYSDMVTGIQDVWAKVVKESPLPYIVPVSPGWDSRPWYGDNALVRTGSTPDLYAEMCRASLRYVDPQLNMVIAECWNEFGEGSYVEPTAQFGFGMLDAMRSVFCPDAGPHTDVTPAELGRTVPNFEPVPSLTSADIVAQGGNLLYNPGAERPWGWQHYDGTAVERTRENPHAGEWCLAMPPERGGMKSLWVVPCEPEKAYRVSAFVRCAPGASATMKVAPFANESSWTGRYIDIASSGSEDWAEVSGEVTCPDDSTYLSVEFIGTGGTVWVDDVSAVPVSP